MEAALTSALPGLLTLSVRVRMNQMGGPVLRVSLLSVTWAVASVSEPLLLLMQWQPEQLSSPVYTSYAELYIGSKASSCKQYHLLLSFLLTDWV